MQCRHANHALLPSLIPHEDPRGGWGPSFRRDSQDRHDRLESLLAAAANLGKIDVAEAKRMLADRAGAGFPICSHVGEAEISTTAAYIVDLSQAMLWVAIGPPDSNNFVRYSFQDEITSSKL